jgi:hypothetical protein
MKRHILRSTLDKIRTAVYKDNIDVLKKESLFLPSDIFQSEKKYLLQFAIINCSKQCTDFLFDKDIKIHFDLILLDCKWNKIQEVYLFCQQFSNEKGIKFYFDKERVIRRLLNPDKVENNPLRVEYLHTLIKNNFVSSKETKEIINEFYVSEVKKANIKQLLREIALKELGI